MEILFKNGNILTMEPAAHQVEALAVQFGRIYRVGRTGDLEKLAGPETKVIEDGDVQIDLWVGQRHRRGKDFAVVQLAAGERAAHGLLQLAPRVEADIGQEAVDRRFQCCVVHGPAAKPGGGRQFKRRTSRVYRRS